MPWKEETVMKQREAFVEAVLSGKDSMSSICREYGISRKTGYKWLERARNGEVLRDESRRPSNQPSKTPQDVEQLILALRQENPSWGCRKIHAILQAQGCQGLPSVKTCGNILKRNGCISPEQSLKHKPFTRFQKELCNQLWQADFKGDFLLLDNTRCYPLTILDDCSRFSLLIDPKDRPGGVQSSFLKAFKTYGLPYAILSDNGAAFAGPHKGLSLFERWLMDLDILPIHGRVMHPQTQGKIERFHRTMKDELLKRQSFTDLRDADRALQNWRRRCNELRPHQALNMKTPASLYTPSDRPYSEPGPFCYSGEYPLVKVNNWGYLRFGPVRVFLSESFANTQLEIRPSCVDTFLVCYRNFHIATVDAISHKLLFRSTRRL